MKCPSCGMEHIEGKIMAGTVVCPACGIAWRSLARVMLLPRLLFNEALTTARIGDWPAAEELAINAVAMDKKMVRAWMLLGKIHAHMEDYIRAIAAWKQVIALEPENSSARAAIFWARDTLKKKSQTPAPPKPSAKRRTGAATAKRKEGDSQ